jgi:hypothetical protein
MLAVTSPATKQRPPSSDGKEPVKETTGNDVIAPFDRQDRWKIKRPGARKGHLACILSAGWATK